MKKSDIRVLTDKIIKFREERGWKDFHHSKDVAISLVLEASELLEHFQWKSEEEMKKHLKTHKEEVGDELADVFYWVLLMGHDFKIDLFRVLNKKMKKNAKKYPI